MVKVHLFLMEREGVSQVNVKLSAKGSGKECMSVVSPMYMLGQWSLLTGCPPRMRDCLCMNDVRVALALSGEKAN